MSLSARFVLGLFGLHLASNSAVLANGNVHVTRFWHNHQPIYWPEWVGDGSEPNRGQLAVDSINKKPFQNYGGLSPRNNPENDLVQIFGLDDRKNAYQGGPSSSLGTFSGGGFAISYSGSLMDNVRQLGGANQLGYGGGWNNGNTSRRKEGRLDLLGFTFHHSLAPLLPKEVFRKELQIFKQAWWKAWDG
jgi:alpha-amylase/alpha-mannosidase (GH57 family)